MLTHGTLISVTNYLFVFFLLLLGFLILMLMIINGSVEFSQKIYKGVGA
jgi:hypothetical protein